MRTKVFQIVGVAAVVVILLIAVATLWVQPNQSLAQQRPTETLNTYSILPTEEPVYSAPQPTSTNENLPFPPTALPGLSRSPTALVDVPRSPTNKVGVFDPNPSPPTIEQLTSDIALHTQHRFIPVHGEEITNGSISVISEEYAIDAAKNYDPKLADQATAISAFLGWYGQPIEIPESSTDAREGQMLVWWVTLSGIVQYSSGAEGSSTPSNEFHILVDASTGKVLSAVFWGAIPH